MQIKKIGAGRPVRENWEMIKIHAWATIVFSAENSPLKNDKVFKRKHLRLGKSRQPSEDLLKKIEVAMPGTRKYFDTVLWKLTHFENFGCYSPRDLFKEIEPTVLNLWVENNWELKYVWRKKIGFKKELDQIKSKLINKKYYLEGLVAVLILMHEAISNQDLKRMNFWLDVWFQIVGHVCNIGSKGYGLSNIYVDLYLSEFGELVQQKHMDGNSSQMKVWKR